MFNTLFGKMIHPTLGVAKLEVGSGKEKDNFTLAYFDSSFLSSNCVTVIYSYFLLVGCDF